MQKLRTCTVCEKGFVLLPSNSTTNVLVLLETGSEMGTSNINSKANRKTEFHSLNYDV